MIELLIAFGMIVASHGSAGSGHAAGPFDVETKPAPAAAETAAAGSSRFLLNKHYHGALDATASGEMLGGGDLKAGNAGYVAIETVQGTLDGKAGSFQLMHWGTMSGGKFELRVEVVPGSGSGALKGIAGTMKIDSGAGGKHSYTLDYTLPD